MNDQKFLNMLFSATLIVVFILVYRNNQYLKTLTQEELLKHNCRIDCKEDWSGKVDWVCIDKCIQLQTNCLPHL